MFYVIDRITGEQMQAEGFWAIGEYGQLYDVIDGWGCEGGGGSWPAPAQAMAVFGEAPVDPVREPEPAKKPQKIYTHRCSCGGRFTTQSASAGHRRDTKQPGPHIISEV